MLASPDCIKLASRFIIHHSNAVASEVESPAKAGRCNEAKDLNQGMGMVIFLERTHSMKRMPCGMVLIYAVSGKQRAWL